jgi:viroplasmin and RNaseH domain-containing protein
MVNIKANLIVSKLPAIEKKVRSTDLVQIPKKKKMKKFRSRDPYMPSILTKNTNCSQIKSQYTFCNIMPQLWKMETIVPEDCVIKYSHPGFFFEEWLKVEILKQDELRKEKKKAKEERRKIREEKRKKRREEEEKQVSHLSLSHPLLCVIEMPLSCVGSTADRS